MDGDEKIAFCRLCLKLSGVSFTAINKIEKDVLCIIPQELNLVLYKDPVICTNCAERLQQCYNFKSSCLYTESRIRSFITDRAHKMPNLTDIYLERCTKGDINIPEDQIVCRLCMKIGMCYRASLNEEAKDMVLTRIMLGKYFPELNLNATKDSAICTTCYVSLQDYFIFMEQCLATEEQITKYCEVEAGNKEQINLHKLLQFIAYNCVEYINDCDGTGIVKKCPWDEQIDEVKLKHEDNIETKTQEAIKSEEVHIKSDKNDFDRYEESPQQEKHLLTHKSLADNAMHQCRLCEYKTKCKAEIIEHVKTHKNTSGFTLHKCSLCPYESYYKGSVQNHMFLHKDEIYQCEVCEFKTKHKTYLPQHMRRKHTPKPEEYSSNSCDYSLKIPKYCMYPDKKPQERSKPDRHHFKTIYQCEECTYNTVRKGRFINHMLVHKNSSELTMYQCELCDFTTKYKYGVKKHAIIHEQASDVTTYQCALCPYKATQKGALQIHTIAHKDASQITMYQCEMCEFKSKRKSNLAWHMSNTHDAKVYSCNLCDYKIKGPRAMKYHMNSHHSETEYHCATCKFKTNNKYSLKKHMVTHADSSQATMYKCELCDHQTKHKHCLKQHAELHKPPSERRTFLCEMCPFKSSYKKTLKAHVKKHRLRKGKS